MTENEALKELNECIGKCVYGGRYGTAMHTAILALNEIQQYRAIGTVEECREARERQRWKKVEYITDMTTLGMLNGICPVCGETAHIDRGCKSDNSYCANCGQNLDWSDTP